MLTIIAFFAILVLLIIAHELGHFVTAKSVGVKVEEFGIGFPPRLFAIKRGETEYSLNIVPLGGFCRLLGEEDPSERRSLARKNKRTRLLVLSAGSLMNILLPLFLFTASFMVPHQVLLEKVRVEKVAPGSPADMAGMKPGDIILEIDGSTVRNRGELSSEIRSHLGSEITLLVQQGESPPRVLKLVPRWNPPAGQGAIGVELGSAEFTTVKESQPFWKAAISGVKTTWETLVLFRNEIAGWFIKKQPPQIAGPIGIARVTGEVVQTGFGPLLSFTALISINLAIFNLLPIPGLDGGRLVFVFLEWLLRGKRISPQRERLVHLIGFAVLIALVVLVSYYDIIRIASGETLAP
jgi:regulator of sigma E protease